MCVTHCLVIRSGFEPETHSLEGCCSIQLSYQTLVGMRLSHERRPVGGRDDYARNYPCRHTK